MPTALDLIEIEVLEMFETTDPEELKTELVQVAAVATSWAEAIDRRSKNGSITKDTESTSTTD